MSNPENIKTKRLLLLHNLGVPIDKDIANIFDRIAEYFNYTKKVVIMDFENDSNTCYIKDDKILLSRFQTKNSSFVTAHISGEQYVEHCFDLMTFDDIDNKNYSLLENMTKIFLKYKGIEFDEMYFRNTNNERNNKYVASLAQKYESGDFKLLKG